jgi:formylglycine-generating enzyme required for sulfatase activity
MGVFGLLLLLGITISLATRPAPPRPDPSSGSETSAAVAALNKTTKPAEPGPRSFAESIGIKIVPIRVGAFEMGSPDSDKDALADEKPRHRVRITKLQGLSAHEVSVGQFRKFVENSGYKTEAESDGKGGYGFDPATANFTEDPKYTWRNPGIEQSDDHPVVNVSWNDAKEFCDWLSRKDGRTYRLPTEAEWEYCCRAGTETLYCNGDDPEKVARVGNVGDASARARYPGWTTIAADDGHVLTAPVGRYEPNGWGLYDMHGNVWEWCLDNYEAQYYKQTNALTLDPGGPSTATDRVVRGGCWYDSGRVCRSALRHWFKPDFRYFNLGFRVARVPSER